MLSQTGEGKEKSILTEAFAKTQQLCRKKLGNNAEQTRVWLYNS